MPYLRRIWKLSIFVFSLIFLALIFIIFWAYPTKLRRQKRLDFFSRWSRIILKVFGIKIQDNFFCSQKGSKRPRILIANHISYLDIPVLASLGPTLFLAKKEVADWPLMGALGRCLGMLFVDRSKLSSRAQAMRDIQEQIRQGYSVVIFPEGTTSETGPLRGRVPFFGGAFRIAREERVPIEILYLEYKPLDRCLWLGEQSFLDHLWKFLGLKNVRVKIRREWLEKMECRSEQREAYLWSREWILEGGHALLSSMKRILWSALLFCFSTSIFAEEEARKKWSSESEAALLLESGNTDVKTWNLRQLLKWTYNDWSYEGRARYLRSEQNQILASEQNEYQLRVTRSLSERLDLLGQANYLRDRFRGFENQFLTDVGASYAFIKNQNTELRFEGAVGYLVEEFVNIEGTSKDGAFRTQAHLKQKINESLDGVAIAKIQSPWSDLEAWRSGLSLGLESPLSTNFKVKTSFELETQNKPAAGNQKSDQRLTVSLLANF
jgi:lyso-ornithine lipid O-acyltransferase